MRAYLFCFIPSNFLVTSARGIELVYNGFLSSLYSLFWIFDQLVLCRFEFWKGMQSVSYEDFVCICMNIELKFIHFKEHEILLNFLK